MNKTTKKLAIASAVGMMFVGSAHAINFDNIASEIITTTSGVVTTDFTYAVPSIADTFTSISLGLGSLLATTSTAVSVIGGSINTGVVNGAIDISGTNVSVGAMIGTVSATASAITSDAYAIAGAKLGTTVIGAMNSSTVDVAAKTTDQTAKALATLNVATLANQGGSVGLTTPSILAALPSVTGIGFLGTAVTPAGLLSASTESTQLSLAGLVSNTSFDVTNKVSELQNMNVFNGAVNVATLDAGIKIAATVDSNAWFLNPQTGVVNLSNIAMATTAIGAMNSSITKLGVSLAK